MTWSSTPPTQPGRYWWRVRPGPDEGRQAYGLALVKWVAFPRMEPELQAVSVTSFFTRWFSGEFEGAQGWSYGSGGNLKTFVAQHPNVEFWSEPERGPEGFLPELPGRPEWTPPDPEEQRAKAKASAAAQKKREAEERKERERRISEAKASGDALYECSVCNELMNESELVEVRECPQCDASFDGSEGRNCPDCNRPFSRLLHEHGCWDCLEECEPVEDPAPARAEAGFEDVYQKFLATKRQCGESVVGLTYEKFEQTLKERREMVQRRRGAVEVRFTVYVKDGRATLKATPVK